MIKIIEKSFSDVFFSFFLEKEKIINKQINLLEYQKDIIKKSTISFKKAKIEKLDNEINSLNEKKYSLYIDFYNEHMKI